MVNTVCQNFKKGGGVRVKTQHIPLHCHQCDNFYIFAVQETNNNLYKRNLKNTLQYNNNNSEISQEIDSERKQNISDGCLLTHIQNFKKIFASCVFDEVLEYNNIKSCNVHTFYTHLISFFAALLEFCVLNTIHVFIFHPISP